jgi:hypothetical protein
MNKLTPLLLIIVAVSLVYWFTYPTYQKIGETKTEIEASKASLKLAQDANAKLVTKKSQYESFTAEDKQKLEKLLPNRIDNFRWIVELSRIAQRHNAKISDVRVTDDPKPSEIGAVNVAFSTSMPYDKFLEYLTDLQKSLKLTDIVNVDFQSADTASGMFTYTISLKSYWLK